MTLRPVLLGGFLALLLVFHVACKPPETKIDDGVIISEKADVLSSTALVATKLGQVKKGDKLGIAARLSVNGEDYVKVLFKGPNDKESKTGWIQARHLISQKTLSQCEELVKSEGDIPTQATGRLKQQSNLRLKPSRDSDVVATLKGGTTFEVVKRVRVEYKPATRAPVGGVETSPPSEEPGAARFDEWYLVRFGSDSVFPGGWLYGGSVEILAPEPLPGLIGPGHHTAACVVIGQTFDSDGGTQKSYIILDKQNFNRDELVDFDRIYVVVWDSATNGYASIYIESNLRGTYPILYKKVDGGTEFSVPLLDRDDKPKIVKYEAVKNPTDGRLRVAKVIEKLPKPAPKPPKKK